MGSNLACIFCCWKCAIFSRIISYDQECIGCTYNLTKQKRKKCICKKSRIHAGVARRPYNMEHWRHVFLFWVACLHAQATYNLELKTSCAVPEQVPDMTCRRVNWLRFHNPRPQNHPVRWVPRFSIPVKCRHTKSRASCVPSNLVPWNPVLFMSRKSRSVKSRGS